MNGMMRKMLRMMTEEDAKLFEKNQLKTYKAKNALKATKEQIEEAIYKHSGLTYDICVELACTPKQLFMKIDKYGLREEMYNARKHLVAKAESTLAELLASSNEKLKAEAAKFVLERLGRDEGWGAGPQVAQQINISTDKDIREIFGI